MLEPATVPVALLVEDDPQIRRFVHAALEGEGWRVFEAGSVARGLIDVASRKADLVILDLGLPDGSGLALIRQVRTWSPLPIIVLSARLDEATKIEALDAGADDYLGKPFGVGELLAGVRAAQRRQRKPHADASGQIHFGDVQVDLGLRQVSKAGLPVRLTPTEYRLLSVLLASAGRVVTSAQLLREVWGPGHTDNAHYLRVYMGHLRQKLEADPAQPAYFLTEAGVGYRLLLPA